tara:strand:- start:883 stop:1698 length:816 start_codon:yes stop_codon:yes gene_type:complete
MREELRFQAANDLVIAERASDGQKFSLRTWQFEMMRRFDGQRSFEQASREVHAIFPGGFTTMGLLNFYRWLYQENLVLCECRSVFELVVDDEVEPVSSPPLREKLKEGLSPANFRMNDWQRQALKVSAIAVFCMGVLRIAYVAAPIFEPPVDRAYAAVENFFLEDAKAGRVARSEQMLPESPVTQMELAGRVPVGSPIEEAPPALEVNVPPIEMLPEKDHSEQIEELRREIAECRVRRDEFYIQNNEAGYRKEVERMTNLAREIGEIDTKL